MKDAIQTIVISLMSSGTLVALYRVFVGRASRNARAAQINREVENQRDKFISDVAVELLAPLRSEIQRLSEDLTSLQGERAVILNRLAVLEVENVSLKRSAEIMQAQSNALSEEVQKLHTENGSLRRDIEIANSNAEGIKREIVVLQAENQSLRSERDKQQVRITALETELHQHKKSL